jgi:methionyl-tRNA formyltransferase
VKSAATELELDVRQPKTLKAEAGALRALDPDVIAVVAYGAILRPDVLAVPRLGCVNVHFSLLPRWRGAAPVERAILAGDERSGVTTMLMDEGLDTGDILSEEIVPIRDDDTTGSLTGRLAGIGAPLLVRTLNELDDGEVVPRRQPADGATYAEKVSGSIPSTSRSSASGRRARSIRAPARTSPSAAND